MSFEPGPARYSESIHHVMDYGKVSLLAQHLNDPLKMEEKEVIFAAALFPNKQG